MLIHSLHIQILRLFLEFFPYFLNFVFHKNVKQVSRCILILQPLREMSSTYRCILILHPLREMSTTDRCIPILHPLREMSTTYRCILILHPLREMSTTDNIIVQQKGSTVILTMFQIQCPIVSTQIVGCDKCGYGLKFGLGIKSGS